MMKVLVIDTDFLFFNEQQTPFNNMFQCISTKIIPKAPNETYNNVNDLFTINEFENKIKLTILPKDCGTVYIFPKISQESAEALAFFIEKNTKKQVITYYQIKDIFKDKTISRII